MACISKISSAITYDCDTGSTGLVSALLINKEDIASIAFDSENTTLVKTITLKGGTSAYKIDTVKRVLTITESLKVNEGAPNAYAHSATVVVTAPSVVTSPVAVSLFKRLINPVANGSFVILTQAPKDVSAGLAKNPCRPFGLYYGLSATAVDRSSHDNGGWYTITMATPERVIGEDALSLDVPAYEALYAAAVG